MTPIYMSPLVTIIIPVYNDKSRLEKCLQALTRQTVPKEIYEILIVDNGSSESLDNLINKYNRNCKLLHEPKRGSYAARNKGIKNAKGKILAFTDADCIPDPEWLSQGMRAVTINKQIGLVGGRIRVEFVGNTKRNMYSLYDYCYSFPQDLFINKGNFAATANMFTRIDVIENVGLFDDRLLSSGDKEWGNRVCNTGYLLVYSRKASVLHPPRDSLYEHKKKIDRIVRGGEAYSRLSNQNGTGRMTRIDLLKSETRLLLKLLKKISILTSGKNSLSVIEMFKVYIAMWVIKHLKFIQLYKVKNQR